MYRKALERFAELPTWQKALIVAAGAPAGIIGGVFAAPAIGAAASAAGIGVLGGVLSGAAASSAGLAALGGGAVVTGGFGVAGGTAVVAAVTALTTTTTLGVAAKLASDAGDQSAADASQKRSTPVADGDVTFEG